MSTELACHAIAEAERAGADITVDADRRIVIDATDPAERATFSPANVLVRPLAWQWELLERLADAPGFTGESDKLGHVRLRLAGKLVDAAGTAVMIDRGWVTIRDGRGAVTAIGHRMLAHHSAAALA